MLGATEHRSERTPAWVPAPWLRGGDEKRRAQQRIWAAWAPKIRRGALLAPLTLATGAEDGGATGDAHRTEGTAACEAGLAGTTVDEELFLLAAELAPCVAIGVHRAASVGDRRSQGFAQGLVQPSGRSPAHGAGDSIRPQSRAVKRFVRVYVAHACDRFLVEKDRFQWGGSLAQPAVELVGEEIRIDRFRAQARHLPGVDQRALGAEEQTPKPARVAVAELLPVIQKENGVRVLCERSALVDEAQLAGHAEVNDKQEIVGEMQEDVLAAPPHGLDPHADDGVDELLWLGMTHDRRKRELRPQYRAPDQVWPQVRDDGLNLGQLRHSGDSRA
jgi:hypothetical protein